MYITDKNAKLGATIPSLNLPAGITCKAGVPCLKDCYAMKAHYRTESVKARRMENLDDYRKDPEAYFGALTAFLTGDVSYRYFRFNDSGDIPDGAYLNYMARTAEAVPGTLFLCYTKKWEIVNAYLHKNGGKFPVNLKIVLSHWGPDMKILNPFDLPTTDVYFPGGPEPDPKAYRCRTGSKCKDGCRRCWLMKPGEQVVFDKH
jgi:hypothetical protein